MIITLSHNPATCTSIFCTRFQSLYAHELSAMHDTHMQTDLSRNTQGALIHDTYMYTCTPAILSHEYMYMYMHTHPKNDNHNDRYYKQQAQNSSNDSTHYGSSVVSWKKRIDIILYAYCMCRMTNIQGRNLTYRIAGNFQRRKLYSAVGSEHFARKLSRNAEPVI